MDEDKFNMSLRRFLKRVGISSQKEIERFVREKKLGGTGQIRVRAVVSAVELDFSHTVEGKIDLG